MEKLKSRHFNQPTIPTAADPGTLSYAILTIAVWGLLPLLQCFAGEYLLADYPKGDLPYITLIQKHRDMPFWGNVLEYELTFSPNFPFDKSRLQFTWSDDSLTQYEATISESANPLQLGYLIDRETHKTSFRALYNHQWTDHVFLWQPPKANIVARYILRLTPQQSVTLATWGLDTLPEGAFAFFHFGDVWQAGTVLPLEQSANNLKLTLQIDGWPLDLSGYRPVDEMLMRNELPELQLFDQIKFTLDEYNNLSERYRQMVSFYRKYELTRYQYKGGMVSLTELLKIKVMLLQELTQMLQIYQTPATVAKKSLRDKEILETISQIVDLHTEEYKAGVMSLDELNGIKEKYGRIKNKIEEQSAPPTPK